MMFITILSKNVKYSNVSTLLKYCTERQTNYNVFIDCFGFTKEAAHRFVTKHGLQHKTVEHLLDVIDCCRNVGFSDREILKNPSVLKFKAMVVKQRYLIMEEGGFQTITPFLIAKYRRIYSKTIAQLKESNVIHPQTDVAQNFVQYLDPCPKDLIVEPTTDNDLWSSIQRKVVTAYLKWRLGASEEQIEKLYRIHKLIAYKCMRYLCENIAIALSLGFTPKQILAVGYLLHNNPSYPKQALQDFGNIAGGDLRRAMRLYPKLVTVSPKNYIKIYGILKEYNISDEAIKRQMNIFQVSPDTARLRLKEICRIPELKVLLNNPRVLSLVVHHNRARSRLSYLQKLQLQCASSIVLGGDDGRFDHHIREGKDVNSIKDILIFLRNLFDKDISEMRKRWKKHPFYLQVPMVRMQETYNYLRSHDFHNGSIYRAFHILLYPREKVSDALKGIEVYDSVKNNNLSEVQILNLILYHIEKHHHFTGNGIWLKNDNVSLDPVKPTE